MDKNENGYPVEEGMQENEVCNLNDLPLAYAYVPKQKWRLLYTVEEALDKGTLFKELYKTLEVYGNE